MSLPRQATEKGIAFTAGAGALIVTDTDDLGIAQSVTFLCGSIIEGDYQSSYYIECGTPYVTSWAYTSYFSSSGTVWNPYVDRYGGGANVGVNSTLPSGDWRNKWITHGFTNNSQASGCQFFFNGKAAGATGTGAAASSYAAGGSRVVSIGVHNGNQTGVLGKQLWTALWARILTATEIAEVHNNPWQLFAPLPARRYFVGAPATGSSIKTVNGLALASVKTVDGLAAASVKTINGLA